MIDLFFRRVNHVNPDFSYRHPSREKFGGVAILLIFLLVACGFILSVLYYLGSKSEERLQGFLQEGVTHIANDDGEKAAKSFIRAEEQINFHLKFYRYLCDSSEKKFTTSNELRESIVSSILMKIYEDILNLKPSSDWIKQAHEKTIDLTGETAEELKHLVATAKEVSGLCELFRQKKYKDVMKGLLAAEKKALPTDQDFFLAEVRLMIACGKALKEPAILTRARELLWFLNSEVGIKGKRMDKLWGVLRQ